MQNAGSYSMFAYCCDAWMVFGAVWLIAAFKTKPVVREQSFLSGLADRIVILLAYFLIFLPWFGVGILAVRFLPPARPYGYAGFALTIAGVAFACWARFYLGGNWSSVPMVKRDHELIRSGPYAIVRHPIYTGILLALLGTAVALGEMRGVIALVAAFVGFRLKSRVEENLMMDEFPSDYPGYMRHVKALVPFVW